MNATSIPLSAEQKFQAIVGPDHVRPATSADSVMAAQPKLIVEPGTEKELAEALRLSNEAGLAVIPRGGGTKLAWGNPPSRADLVLSTARLNQIIEHAWADLTVTVEAGCTIQKLQQTLAQHGQRLALDALWPEKATVGGILSTNESGALRLRFGALRDLIIGVTIALPDGTLASSGGKVVKNVAGYDLPKLITGALGTLGIITRASFRLHPLPLNTRTFSVAASDVEQAQKFVLAVQDSKLAHTSLQSRFCDENSPVSDVLFEGTIAGLAAQEKQLRTLAAPANVVEASASIWASRESLWSFSDPETTAMAKFSILPTAMTRTIESLGQIARGQKLCWKAVHFATGLGHIRLKGEPGALHAALELLRKDLEGHSSSLVLLHHPAKMLPLDAWGSPGDSLPLMKSVKHRLDPANTLNPGRFLAGI